MRWDVEWLCQFVFVQFREMALNWLRPKAVSQAQGVFTDILRTRSDLIAENALLR